jgi:hypothetical protein
MLQELIKDLQSSLKSYNQGLSKQNILVDIPWTMVDGDLNIQRLIFRKENTLYIVKEGEINESKWEFISAMNSIIIELAGKKILLNEVYADGKALILKKDGSNMDFFAFVNQKEVPDLNLIGYFHSLELREKENEKVKKAIKVEETQKLIDPYHYPGSKPFGCVNSIILFVIVLILLLNI